MNSFFIPQLGSMIYGMAGMQTQDHLIADHPGKYGGLATMINGRGFADMHFTAIATDGQGRVRPVGGQGARGARPPRRLNLRKSGRTERSRPGPLLLGCGTAPI